MTINKLKVVQHATASALVTMGGDFQPGCLADRLLIGLDQQQISP